MTAASWYLVFMGGMQYIGPLPQPACQMAAVSLRAEGVVCRQASMLMSCDIPNQPGALMICPKFDFPEVTIK